ncbi:MAG: GreA/GreB family elongation factor [Gammaproteobacteria bacterium]
MFHEVATRFDHISVDSPLARALLKKTYGAEVTITTDSGNRHYRVIDIDYQQKTGRFNFNRYRRNACDNAFADRAGYLPDICTACDYGIVHLRRFSKRKTA